MRTHTRLAVVAATLATVACEGTTQIIEPSEQPLPPSVAPALVAPRTLIGTWVADGGDKLQCRLTAALQGSAAVVQARIDTHHKQNDGRAIEGHATRVLSSEETAALLGSGLAHNATINLRQWDARIYFAMADENGTFSLEAWTFCHRP